MKKKVLKKLLCTVLAAVCIVTSVAPVMADDVVTTEASSTREVTAKYKYHLEGYDYKKHDWRAFSKSSFYKDLNSLSTLGMGKNHVNVPALPKNAKTMSFNRKDIEEYSSFVKFKAPKTGTYVFTLTNLEGTDDKALRAMVKFGIEKVEKVGKKYRLGSLECYEVGDYDRIYENNYLEKLRSMIDTFENEHPDYIDVLENDYEDEADFVKEFATDKIMFTVKLKKGQTYVYGIDNAGMTTLGRAYYNDATIINSQSCLRGGNYTAAYSFDMEIKLKTKK